MYLCQEMLVYCLYICYYYYDCISTASYIFMESAVWTGGRASHVVFFLPSAFSLWSCPQILAMWFCGVSRRINKLSKGEQEKRRENMKREQTDGQ
jgi:hypothetical protein